MTQEEAAALLDISVKTVKRRWLKARILLKGGDREPSGSSGVI
jgi:hypothetical protein